MEHKKGTSYPAEFKVKVVRELLKEEKSLAQVASDYGVHPHVLTRWRDQMLAGLPSLFDERNVQALASKEAAWEKEREELYAEIGKLTTQMNWLKKTVEAEVPTERK